jgi:hypothetical protein
MSSAKLIRAALAIALAFVLLQQNGEANAGSGSPLSLISGSYAMIFSGYAVSSSLQPFSGTGLIISDGQGHLTGHEVFNFNGQACSYQLSGTYTVATDGTGTNDITFFNGTPSGSCPSGSYTESLTVVDGGNRVLLSNTNSPDVGTDNWYREGTGNSQ